MAGTLGVAVAVCALGPTAIAHALTYRVAFEIHNGKYMSSYSCLPGCEEYGGVHRFSESDEDVATSADYNGLKVPANGPAVKPGHPIALHGSLDPTSIAGEWRFAESYWTSDNPNAQVNCRGPLYNTTKQAPLLSSAPGSSTSELRLYIQSGDLFQPSPVTGTNCDAVNAQHWHAFYPAVYEPPGDGYLPDMLTAHIGIPLAQIRKMKVGDKWGIGFHQNRAKRLPPTDCSDFTGVQGECTQSLHWAGSVSVTRTG
jgi:hypothetical protein